MQPNPIEKSITLLSNARRILQYEAVLTKTSGEGFNIFNLLGVGTSEVKTHSPFLAELLSPKGSHGQGSVFLDCFCKLRGIRNFDVESGRVKKEYHIGPKTEEEGGRVDIVITDRFNRHIVIENKIFAGLQENQLGRYRNRFSDLENDRIFLLTLSGNIESAPEQKIECISYQSDILFWLKQCRKEAAEAPLVRETISQYIHLIQQLTNQNTNSRMNDELAKAILQDETTFLAYGALCRAKQQIDLNILAVLKDELETASSALGLELAFIDTDLSARYDGFSFTSPAMALQNVRITFQFQTAYRGNCCLGFTRVTENAICPSEAYIFQEFRGHFPTASGPGNSWWVANAYWEQHKQWGEDTLAAIKFGGGAFSSDVVGEVKKLLEIITKANLALAI